jgi:putative ABC transport system substrate-binding protein
MQRRQFITLLGASAAASAWPLAAGAQQDTRVRRVGLLTSYVESDQEAQARLQVFRRRLAELGWTEGRNLLLDVRWGGVDVAAQRSHARELVASSVAAILTTNITTTRAAQAATRTVPIVFAGLGDAVMQGVVSNLARPEANVTGFMTNEPSLAGKVLGLLKDMAPRLAHVTVLNNSDLAPNPFLMRAAQEAGERLMLKVVIAEVRDGAGIEAAIAVMAGREDAGLAVLGNTFNLVNRATTIALAAKYRVPAIYFSRVFAEDGGLMSYGPDGRRPLYDAATYVDRILHGAKPAELPVQFPTKFELLINMNTAKALGVTVSQDLLSIADEVIG